MDESYLSSARAKLRWAERHLKRLNGLNTRYIADAVGKVGLDITNEIDGEGRKWSVTTLSAMPPLPGEDMSLIAGDAMHNTRTALDHLACACVRASGKEPTIQTAFPINQRSPTGRFREIYRAKVARMDSTYVDAITRLQPYRTPNSEESRKLIRLATLDNLDKHKLLIPTVTVGRPDPLVPPFAYGNEPAPAIYNTGVPLASGVELLRQRLPKRRTGQGIYGGAPIIIEVRFGSPDVGLVELFDIRSYVVGIVESFGPSFDR